MFRTDKSYDRFNRGSELSWEITAGLRTVARRLASFTARDAYSPAEREAAIELIDAICLTHAWVMNAHLRPAPPSAPSATERGRDILRVALGARPLARLVRKEIAEPLSEEVLYGRLVKGGAVAVDANEDGLVFTFPERVET